MTIAKKKETTPSKEETTQVTSTADRSGNHGRRKHRFKFF